MSQYAVLIYTSTSAGDVPDEPGAEAREAHTRYADELIGAGTMVAAFALESPLIATSIRGDTMTVGPFVTARELLAGFYVIEAPDLDAALEIARRNPATREAGGVEVRPVEGGFIADRS